MRQVFQENRVHRAFETNMHLVDFALGDGDQFDAEEREVLVKIGHVGLIAGEAIECLGDNDFECAISGGLKV